MVTTREIKELVKDLMRPPLDPEERVRYLPTYDQLKVIISFLRASKKCESVRTTEIVRGQVIPKRAICIAEKFNEIHKDTLEWIKENPEEFEKIYRSIYWG